MSDIAPKDTDIRWDVTADSLMDICDRHWPALLPELQRAQREAESGRRLDEGEYIRRLRSSIERFRR